MKVFTVLVLVAVLVGGCSSSGGSPVAPPSGPAPTAVLQGTRCQASPSPEVGQRGDPRVSVRSNPTGVTATWLPGLNVTACATAVTTAPAATAHALALDIDGSQPYPPGTYSCPSADGTGVELVFRYTGRTDEEVLISLTGCATIAAPGRSGRELTEPVRHDLAGFAAPAWATYFTS